MNFLRFIPSFLRSKYLLTLSVFAVWMVFFDKNDVFTQLQRSSELAEIEDSKAYFAKKIEESKKFSQEIQSDAAAIEKFAREKYHMKRENEDLFLIVPATKE
ncbi:MAG: septum formation initiator family protein [Bacteroidota bacterium]|nr:septum formation initiator family protein [Bacteroidota bacterium]